MCIFLSSGFDFWSFPSQGARSGTYNALCESVFLCFLDRANLQAHPAPYTNLLIDLWVLKPFFIFLHIYCGFRTNRITRRAATAVFFSFVKNWYIFHCVFPLCSMLYVFSASTIIVPLVFLSVKYNPFSFSGLLRSNEACP